MCGWRFHRVEGEFVAKRQEKGGKERMGHTKKPSETNADGF